MSAPLSPTSASRRWTDRLSLAFVAAVLAGLTALCALLLLRYANRVPERDDLELGFMFLPEADWRFVLGRMWSPLNEHRIFLSELVRYALVVWTRDFRSAAWFQLGVIALLSLAFVLAARRLRGRSSPLDVVFPLLWLSWGNAHNFLLGVQICLTFATALACTALLAATWRAGPPSAGRVHVVGACSVLMPLCGGFGLCQSPAWLVWLAGMGIALLRSAREPAQRRSGWIALGWSAALVAMIAAYFHGLNVPERAVAEHTLGHAFVIAGQFLSLIFGPAAEQEPWWTVGTALVLLVLGLALAARAWAGGSGERWRAPAIATAIAGTLGLGLGIGWSRQDAYPVAGYAARYVTAATPAFAAAVLALVLYAPRWLACTAIGCSIALLGWLFELNRLLGEDWARGRHNLVLSFTHEAQQGTPIPELAKAYGETLYVAVVDFQARVEMLQGARLPPYDRAPSAPIGDTQLGVYLCQDDVILSPNPVLYRRVNNLPALAVRAPASVHLHIPPGAHGMNGVVGVLPLSYSRFLPSTERTPGIRVSVEVLEPSGQATIQFYRELDPARRIEDRDPVPFRVTLADDAEGEIVLRCESLGEEATPYDWAAWSFVPPR